MASDRAFDVQLVEVVRSPDFRTAVVQRLVAASIDAAEGARVLDLAIDRAREESRGRMSNLSSRILRAVEAACVDYAGLRGLPYKKVVGPLTRRWQTLLTAATQAGLNEEEAYAVMRDLLRKIPASHWSRVEDIDREVCAEMKFGFSMFGIAKGRGRETRHAGSRN